MTGEHPIKAVLFDLDGTLVDSAPDLHIAANKLLMEQKRAPLSLEQITMMIGDGVPKLVERAFAASGAAMADNDREELTGRYLELYEPHSADLSVTYAGAVDCLAGLHAQGFALGVCTNKPHRPALEVLQGLGFAPFLSVVIGGDSLPGVRKPDPRHLLAALESLGVEAGGALMVGDNANDVNAARAAGIRVVVCRFGYTQGPAENLGGDWIIDHLNELPRLIEDIPGA